MQSSDITSLQLLSRRALIPKRFLDTDQIFFRHLLRGSTTVQQQWVALAFLCWCTQISKDKWLVSLLPVQPLGRLVLPCYMAKWEATWLLHLSKGCSHLCPGRDVRQQPYSGHYRKSSCGRTNPGQCCASLLHGGFVFKSGSISDPKWAEGAPCCNVQPVGNYIRRTSEFVASGKTTFKSVLKIIFLTMWRIPTTVYQRLRTLCSSEKAQQQQLVSGAATGGCSTRQGHCQLPGAASQGGAGPHDGQAQPHGTQRARAEQLQQLPPGQSKAQMTTQVHNGKLVQGPASKWREPGPARCTSWGCVCLQGGTATPKPGSTGCTSRSPVRDCSSSQLSCVHRCVTDGYTASLCWSRAQTKTQAATPLNVWGRRGCRRGLQRKMVTEPTDILRALTSLWMISKLHMKAKLFH